MRRSRATPTNQVEGHALSPRIMPLIEPRPASAGGSVPVLCIPLAQVSSRGTRPLLSSSTPTRPLRSMSPVSFASPNSGHRTSAPPYGEPMKLERSTSGTHTETRKRHVQLEAPSPMEEGCSPRSTDSVRDGGISEGRRNRLRDKFLILDGHRLFNFGPHHHRRSEAVGGELAVSDVNLLAHGFPQSSPHRNGDFDSSPSPRGMPTRRATVAPDNKDGMTAGTTDRSSRWGINKRQEFGGDSESPQLKTTASGSPKLTSSVTSTPLKSSLKSTGRPSPRGSLEGMMVGSSGYERSGENSEKRVPSHSPTRARDSVLKGNRATADSSRILFRQISGDTLSVTTSQYRPSPRPTESGTSRNAFDSGISAGTAATSKVSKDHVSNRGTPVAGAASPPVEDAPLLRQVKRSLRQSPSSNQLGSAKQQSGPSSNFDRDQSSGSLVPKSKNAANASPLAMPSLLRGQSSGSLIAKNKSAANLTQPLPCFPRDQSSCSLIARSKSIANSTQQMLPPMEIPSKLINPVTHCNEIRSKQDKYRDQVVVDLFEEATRVASDPSRPGTSASPNCDRIGVAFEVASILNHIAEELGHPMRDSSAAMKRSATTLKRTVDICRDLRQQKQNPAPTEALVSALAKIARKKAKLGGGRHIETATKEFVDTGVIQVLAEALSYNFMSPRFPQDAFPVLSDGLSVEQTRAAVKQICIDENVPDAAERILNAINVPHESKQAASEFDVHFASASHSHLPPMPQGATVDLPVLMRVVRRRVRNNRSIEPPTQVLHRVGSEDLSNLGQGVSETSESAVDLLASLQQNKNDLKLICKQLESNPLALKDSDVAASFAELVNMVALKRRINDIEDAAAHELLLKFLQAQSTNPDVVGSCLDAFSSMCEDSVPMQLFVSRHVPPAVQCQAIADDPDAAWKYVDLLEDLVVYEEGSTIEQMAIAKVLKDLDIVEAAADPDDSLLFSAMEDIRNALQREDSSLTLKEVYSILMARQYHDDTLNVTDERTVRRLFNFVRRKIDQYATKEPILDGIFSFIGSEFMYGCMSLQLLSTVEDNHPIFTRWEIPNQMLKCMEVQTDEQMAHHAVLTAVELAQHPALARHFVDTKFKRDLVVQMLHRARMATENDVYNDVEDLVGPRVQLIERTAETKETFQDTNALQQLIETWDDYDYYFFGDIRVKSREDLEKVFKLNRREKRKEKIDHRLGRTIGRDGEGRNSVMRRTSQSAGPGGSVSRRGSEVSATSLKPSPLDRRRSVIHPVTQGAVSPLERRRSVIAGGGAGDDAPQGGGGLMRRASQFFGGAKHKDERVYPPGLAPAVGSIATARRMSASGMPAGLPRRSSMMGRRSSLVGRRSSLMGRRASHLTSTTPLHTEAVKASNLQRRASMAPPSGAQLRIALNKLGDSYDRPNTVSDDSDGTSSVYRRGSRFARQTSGALSPRSMRSGDGESLDLDFNFDPDYWQQQDETFVPRMLEFVFRAIRKVAGPNQVNILLEHNVPMRLVGLIADPETPPVAFADILYLIGVLAANGKEQKDQLREYEAIEKICSLLKRAHKQQGAYVTEVVTNACLALATMCVVDLPNTRRFEKKRGHHIVVSTLQVRGAFNDAASVNAASRLICNLCFKNEEMKRLLGEAGACEALVSAMSAYHSGICPLELPGGRQTSRSLASLFRAIGNLALNQDNMGRFMAAHIETAYAGFLGQVDTELDDPTLEASLRTLSNLVIEKDNMERFACVVVPFLSMIRRERTTSTEVHRWAFLTLANLCRLPKNAQTFSVNDGIRTIIKLLPYIESTAQLRASIIICLGIQTTYPENIENLIENDIFEIVADCLRDFLTAVADNHEGLAAMAADLKDRTVTAAEQAKSILEYSQLPISCLRCCHRVLRTAAAAREAIKNDILDLAQQVLIVSEFQPMLTYEALRVIFAITALIDPTRDPADFVKSTEVSVLSQTIGNVKKEGESEKSRGSRWRRDRDEEKTLPTVEYHWGEEQLNSLIAGEAPVPGTDGCYEDPCHPEWIITLGKQVIRPGNAIRIWEELEMTSRMCQMVEIVRRIASNNHAIRNVRLQKVLLGFLCWVSCDRICLPNLLRRLNVPIDPETHAPVQIVPANDSDSDYEVPKAALQRHRSMWDVLKRNKTKKTDTAKENPFGRHRKPDHTSVIDILQRTLQNLWFDHDAVNLAMILLNSCIFMSFGTPALAELVADVALYKQLEVFCNQAGEDAHAYWLMTLQNYKRFLQTEAKWTPLIEEDHGDASDFSDTGPSKGKAEGDKDNKVSDPKIKRKRVLTGEDLGLMEVLALTQLPADLTKWDVDPFPDGVQSLPAEKRRWLREGGQAECVDDHGDKQIVLWKASHDLVVFEWKIFPLNTKSKQILDTDPQYPHGLAVSRFSTMANGADHPWFVLAAQKDRSISDPRCCYLKGPATPTQPQGVNLCIRLKDSSARDLFMLMMSEWREACAFGFI